VKTHDGRQRISGLVDCVATLDFESEEIDIEVIIVYNMYRMRRFYTKNCMRRLLSLGPPNFAIHGTYKSGLDREPPISNLFKGVRGFYYPRGGSDAG
jgi:hypothetical protein